jgi:hypothetical protein
MRTVENVRQAFVLEGFQESLTREKRATPPTPKLLDVAAEAKLIAMRLGKPPAGFGRWTPRLLGDQMVNCRTGPRVRAADQFVEPWSLSN